MISEEIKKIISTSLGVKVDEVDLEHPANFDFGDYSTNIAMKLKQDPNEIVKKIGKIEGVEKIEVAGNGFINFFLSRDFFTNSIKEILDKGSKFGENEELRNQKILIEHSSPNLFKEFHIGHLVNNCVGESISNVIEKSGANLIRTSYPSDIGLGIAKAVWAIKKENKKPEELSVDIIGKMYVLGSSAYESDEEAKKEIENINIKIYNKEDESILKIYKKGIEVSLKYFEDMVKMLGSKFEDYFFESEAGKEGEKIVKENFGKVFEESDGAIIFKAEKFDEKLHTRVFINSKGLPTYEAKDIGLLKLKFDKYSPHKSVLITDHEQGEYMKVVLKAAEMINSKWSDNSKHIVHGRLRFPEGRLSSRKGKVITVSELMDEMKEEILEKLESSEKEFSKGEINDVVEKISLGAIKYSILKSSIGKNIVFDRSKALSLEGDSGPYLQYTVVRANSIVNKAIKLKNKKTLNVKIENNNEISNLEKLLYRFPEIVKKAGEEYTPNTIVTYLTELASAFNSYYAQNKILDSEYRLALTKAVSIVMKNGLEILGIKIPDKM